GNLGSAGIPPPKPGGDARGWKRLLQWRTDLGHGLVAEGAQQEYQAFTRKVATIPACERVQRARSTARGPQAEVALARNAANPSIAAGASAPVSARPLPRSASVGCARSWRPSWRRCR